MYVIAMNRPPELHHVFTIYLIVSLLLNFESKCAGQNRAGFWIRNTRMEREK
jgi:hypothetical protein